MYVALAEGLEEPLLTGDQPLARAVMRHTGVTIDLVA
jgi:predicted nucleic acid-binding protein